VTDSEVKDIQKDGHEDSDETGSIGSGGTIGELSTEEAHDDITQDVQKDSQESIGSGGTIE